MKNKKKLLIGLIAIMIGLTNLVACANRSSDKTGVPKEIRLDYATYNIESLVIKEKGWLEDEFKNEGTKITFVQSQGSNKSLEFLQSSSIDFGSTAGGAALISKSKNNPIEGIYIYSKPEWAALVTTKDSNIKSPADLKGKKIAATVGTDPHIFLLRALEEVGLNKNDIEFIPLQHSDGANALVTNQIDAWSGLDPYIAKVEIENNAKLFYRNVDFNTYGFLNVRTEFAEKYPESVKRVIKVYEKAKKWIIENPKEAVEIFAKEASLNPEIAKKQLERTNFQDSIPGEDQKKSLIEAAKILKKENIIPDNTDIQKTVDELVISSYAKEALQ